MTSGYRMGPLVWSIGLVSIGAILLLFNFDVFARIEPIPQYVVAALFGVGAAAFFLGYFTANRDWARLIPGWTLVALASMVFASTLPFVDPGVTVSLLFFGLAIAFANIYLLDRKNHWWAVIPGGFMLIIGLVIAFSARITRTESLATMLFMGMGLVFLALYWLGGKPRRWWALVPGSVLLLFSLFLFSLDSGTSDGMLRFWPLTLIVLGILIGIFSVRKQPDERLPVNVASTLPKSKDESQELARLGEYSRPAPGANVEILTEPDE